MVYRFTLKRPPYNSTIVDGEFGKAAAGKDASLRDGEAIHDGDYIVTSSASALNIPQQLAGNQVVHILAEVGRMQGDIAFAFHDEEHDGGVLCRMIGQKNQKL